ncbi:MAG: YceI family protein [Altererythrobacter sp.]|nr:YceI family protein [Altererythrobacter sp.]
MKPLLLAAAPALVLLGMAGYATLDAQTAPPPALAKAEAARVEAGRYTVDGAHTLVGWRVNHFGFNDYFGIFGDVAGSLEINPKNLAATRLDVTIPVAKVTVASSGLRDHLLAPGKNGGKPDFFGAAPADARFVSTSVHHTGGNRATIVGDFTLNGITRPVTLAAEFTGAGPHPMNKRLNIGFQARGHINRSEFGIAYAIPLVSDRVELDITAAFEKSDAVAAAPDRCKAGAAADAVGRRDTPALRAEVARKIGHGSIRWLKPGSVVTQDYREDRLNVDLDAGGVVTRLSCG